MSFRSPLVLLLAAVLVPGALALVAYAARQRVRALRLFLGRSDRQSGTEALARQRTVQAWLLAGALAAAAVALAGPRVGTALRQGEQESLDLLIALDVSDSMRASDVAPSRLERAKLEIERIVDARRGDRVGLIVFAGEAFLQCPLTTDRGALRLFLDAADPEQVSIQGTDFARALEVADRAFDAAAENQDARPRALLVVSDGEDHEGGLEADADALREDGVEILALGVGTDQGAPVPEVYRGREVGDRTDRTGTPIVTRFEPGALQDLAGRDGLTRIARRPAAPAINDALDRLDRAVVAQEEFAAEAERYQWPLGLALLLLLAERIVALRRPRAQDAPPADDDAFHQSEGAWASPPRAARAAAALAVLLLGGCLDALQPGVSDGRVGAERLAEGDAPGAEAAFVSGLARPEVPRDVQARLWHGLGLARAEQERYAQADSALAQALSRASRSDQRARYAYNAGTAALLADDPQRADSLLRRSLLIDPTSADARRNQEIARRRLQDPPEPPEPSDFARQLKARADSLIDLRQYGPAFDVMEEGLRQDSTVQAYQDFIDRLGGVVDIEANAPAAPDPTLP